MPAVLAEETLEEGEHDLDALCGLYFSNRYYDPATAEFLTIDPLAAATASAYVYTDGNPLNGSDPSGLSRVAREDDGSGLTISQIRADPSQLKDMNPDDLLNALGGVPDGFTVSPGQSKSAGLGPGWKLSSQQGGGITIRWSPGSARADHPETPYWRVSGGGDYGTSERIPAAEWPNGAPDFVNGPVPPADDGSGDPCLMSYTAGGCSGGFGGFGRGDEDPTVDPGLEGFYLGGACTRLEEMT